MRKLKLGFVFTFFLGIMTTMGILIVKNCLPLPEAQMTLGIHAEDDGIIHKPSVDEAMSIINRFVGCEFLVPGKDVRIMSTDGEPCGKAFHKDIPKEHYAAYAYKCNPSFSTYRGWPWEVHVQSPGDIHLQVCIAAHEIGHAAGLEDKPNPKAIGIMNQKHCPDTQIILSDDEVDFLNAQFCP